MRRLFAAAFVALVFLSGGCGNEVSPTESTPCRNVAGDYFAWGSMFCPSHFFPQGGVPVTVAQRGCDVSFTLPSGNVAGKLDGWSGTFTITFGPTCGGTATGTVALTETTVTGAYTGTVVGAASECCPGPISGGFNLTR